MDKPTLRPLPALVTILLAAWLGGCCGGGSKKCDRDTDCKGKRICVDGACESPKKSAPSPGAAAPRPASGQSGVMATVEPPPSNRNGVVRAAPAVSADKVTELPRGFVVSVVARSPDGLWRKVQWQGGEGWMHQDVLIEPGRRPAPQAGPYPGGPCRDGEPQRSCTCPNGRRGSMVCFGRSLTWSACDCR
jgi:hypothetical protein